MVHTLGDNANSGFNIGLKLVGAPGPYRLEVHLVNTTVTPITSSPIATLTSGKKFEVKRVSATQFTIATTTEPLFDNRKPYLFKDSCDVKITWNFPLQGPNSSFWIIGGEDDRPNIVGNMFYLKLDDNPVGNIVRISYAPLGGPNPVPFRLQVSHNHPVPSDSITLQRMSCHKDHTGITRWGVTYQKNPCNS